MDFYTLLRGQHPRLQIPTVYEQLDVRRMDMPQTRGINLTLRQAPKAKVAVNWPGQLSLLDDK